MQLGEYMKELNKVRLLEPQREKELWQAYKVEKKDEARGILIESYQPLVFKNAMQFQRLDNIMDVIQEGTVGLIEAVESYDFSRGTAFSLYAMHRIRGRMLNFVRKEGHSDITCIDGQCNDSSDFLTKELIADTSVSVDEQAEHHVLVTQLHNAMQRLPQKERIVLESVYLRSRDIQEVADSLNVSTSHIYRLQKTGIRRVRGMLAKFMQYW